MYTLTVMLSGIAMRLWGGSVGPILWPWGSTRRFWPNSMPLRAGHWRCAGATLLSGPTNRCWTTPSIARSILWKNTASGASSTSRTGSGMAAFEYRQAEEIRDALRRRRSARRRAAACREARVASRRRRTALCVAASARSILLGRMAAALGFTYGTGARPLPRAAAEPRQRPSRLHRLVAGARGSGRHG